MGQPTLHFLATVGFALSAFAQPGADPTRFKVASIKPAVPQEVGGCIGAMCGGPRTNNPAFSYLGAPLVSVLEWAYGIPAFHIFGGPSWLTEPSNSHGFDIVATVPPGTTDEQFKVMLQNLMLDRLGLKVHHETRNLPLNTLTIATGGPKLEETQIQPSGSLNGSSGNHRFTLSADGAITIATLVITLQNSLNEVVVDETGLTGMYKWSDAPAAGGAPWLPTLADALEQGLGLKLEKSTKDFDVLVIDHVERVPTGN